MVGVDGIVRAEDYGFLAQHNFMIIKVGDLIGPEQHGVVSEGDVIIDTAFRGNSSGKLTSDVRDGQRFSRGVIILLFRPSAEEHAIVQGDTGIVNELPQAVTVLDVHGSDQGSVRIAEFYQQAGVDHSVDRKSVGLESSHAVADLGIHHFDAAVVVQVSDLGSLADRIRDESHLDRSQRLDFIAVRVDEGDVDGSHVLGLGLNAHSDLFQHSGIIDRSKFHFDLLVKGAGRSDHIHGDAGGLAGEESGGRQPDGFFFICPCHNARGSAVAAVPLGSDDSAGIRILGKRRHGDCQNGQKQHHKCYAFDRSFLHCI